MIYSWFVIESLGWLFVKSYTMQISWLEWRLGDSLGISDRGTKAKSITSCDNAFVTNVVLARDPGAQRMFSVRKRSVNVAAATKAAHRTPPGKRPAGTEINHLLVFSLNMVDCYINGNL